MERELITFYYQFHNQQHYFLCHDILEEAWKNKKNYSKKDACVSLILLATGCYHYRRNNFKGASRSFNKALMVIKHYSKTQVYDLGLDYQKYIDLLKQLVIKSEQHEPFVPVTLPLTDQMIQNIIEIYPDYEVLTTIIHNDIIKHHHLYRDRTEVIEARNLALAKRQEKRILNVKKCQNK
ncbi:DUF309 domain-containing protein [Staphylococcus canis]|uniref:DUF309 domain-containing protein n=1 Tax=Staphylococcus canis TaxID=2724942 RepID=A0ABS0TBJ6_9STAP|nr:DUF309 domain-containing protein [Staphylococcus canis]MBI5975336.1 DUF309 domain-containing protein [Staphylococcus canis]